MNKNLISYCFKMKLLLYGLGIFLNLSYLHGQESAASLFSSANNAYNEANYSVAIEYYQKILAEGQHSAELYYNLGNAYYRINQVAESIYYFEKAKQLDPKNQDIQMNSSFAKNMTIDAIEPLPRSQFAELQFKLFDLFGLKLWAQLSLILVWIFALLFLGYLITQNSNLKRKLFFLSLTVFFLFLGTFSITYFKDLTAKENKFAILFSKQIDTWSEPNQQGDVLFILHEGTKVQLLDSLSEWQKIRIANGSEGWLKNADFRSLN